MSALLGTIPGYDGYCTILRAGDEIDVPHADPRVTMSAELVDQLRDGYAAPRCTLVDDIFTIRAISRTIVYRIGEYNAAVNGYPAELVGAA